MSGAETGGRRREGDDAPSRETLSSVFNKGLELRDQLEASDADPRGEPFQRDVRKAILLLEDATRMVSALDLFSRNEDHSELTTGSLKYLLLPALLGDVNAKLAEDHDRRLEVIRVVETYYMDFLRRVKDYCIVDYELPKVSNDDEEEEDGAVAAAAGPPNLAKMSAERESKVKRFREKKELESQLKGLRASGALDDDADDEGARSYHMKLVRSFALRCLDEMSSYEAEKPIIAHMAKVGRRPEQQQPEAEARLRRPLKPVIITRDAVQKAVFGLGYKNLPVMTVEEFYEQRVRDGWFPTGKEAATAPAPNDAHDGDESDESDDDDPEELARKRAMDEYKDWHKRGEGNMHNKG